MTDDEDHVDDVPPPAIEDRPVPKPPPSAGVVPPPPPVFCGGAASSDDGDEGPVPKRPRVDAIMVEGCPIKVAKAYNDGTHTYNSRWSVVCNIAGHPKHEKSRSIIMDKKFGQDGTKHFLGCWLKNPHGKSAADHGGWTPTQADVRAYIDSLP